MDRRTTTSKASVLAKEIFDSNKWTWYGDEIPPSLKEITTTINYLIDTLQDPQYDRDQVSTGRLTVQRSPYLPDDDESFMILLQIGDYINED